MKHFYAMPGGSQDKSKHLEFLMSCSRFVTLRARAHQGNWQPQFPKSAGVPSP
jgi:hypothetical protein